MAFNSAAGRAEYTATAGQTVFPFTFKIFLDGDIKVYLTPSGQTPDDTVDLLTITTEYTVSINGDNGGDITLVSGASAGDSITLVRELDINRLIEYQTNGDLLAETLNDDQDYQTYLIADKETENTRFLRLADTAQGVSTELPAPVSNAYFKWNADADAIENDTTIPDAVTDAAASAAAAAVSETNAATSETNAATSASEAAASAASIDPTKIIHTDGSGEDNELSTLAVNLTTAQTVVGIKTFSASPLVPTPTTDLQASTKKYVDDTVAAVSTGKVLQEVSSATGALATLATLIPFDDTIPQISEGTQVLSLAITPISATSKLKIHIETVGSLSTGAFMTCALFRDAIVNALKASFSYYDTGTTGTPLSLSHNEASGAITPTTFTVRLGIDRAATYTLNGVSGARKLGGVSGTIITITEVEV